MKCNCANWDTDEPCEVHANKLPQPEYVEHSCIVIRVMRRRETKKWFYTVTRDAVRELVSKEFDTKKEATPI